MTGMRPLRSFAVSPNVVIWEVTRACDLRCLHCRADAMWCPDPNELGPDEGLALLDQLVELAPDVVVLTGGDPLKRPDLLRLVREGRARGLRLALAPSVTPLLTDRAIAELVEAGVSRIALSLDGPDPGVHDACRGVPGAFRRTLDAAAAVRASGAALQVNTSVTAATLPRLAETAALVTTLRPALWSVFFVVPTGRAGVEQEVGAGRAERAFHLLYDWSAATGLPVKTTAAPAYRRVFVQREAARARSGGGRRPAPGAVNEGRGFCFVSHTGDVCPSGFLPLTLGNVRTRRLAEIYREHPVFRALRDVERLGGKCGACQFRTLCGGSRGRAYAHTGDPLAEDPACAYDPATNAVRAVG
jgi:radical SAM protein